MNSQDNKRYAVNMRKVSLPDEALPATLELNPDLHMSDDEYFEIECSHDTRWHKPRD